MLCRIGISEPLRSPALLKQQTLGEVPGEEVDRQAEDVQGSGFVGVVERSFMGFVGVCRVEGHFRGLRVLAVSCFLKATMRIYEFHYRFFLCILEQCTTSLPEEACTLIQSEGSTPPSARRSPQNPEPVDPKRQSSEALRV